MNYMAASILSRVPERTNGQPVPAYYTCRMKVKLDLIPTHEAPVARRRSANCQWDQLVDSMTAEQGAQSEAWEVEENMLIITPHLAIGWIRSPFFSLTCWLRRTPAFLIGLVRIEKTWIRVRGVEILHLCEMDIPSLLESHFS